MRLKVKELRDYLHLHEIPTQMCREKEELVELVLGQHTPSSSSSSSNFVSHPAAPDPPQPPTPLPQTAEESEQLTEEEEGEDEDEEEEDDDDDEVDSSFIQRCQNKSLYLFLLGFFIHHFKILAVVE